MALSAAFLSLLLGHALGSIVRENLFPLEDGTYEISLGVFDRSLSDSAVVMQLNNISDGFGAFYQLNPPITISLSEPLSYVLYPVTLSSAYMSAVHRFILFPTVASEALTRTFHPRVIGLLPRPLLVDFASTVTPIPPLVCLLSPTARPFGAPPAIRVVHGVPQMAHRAVLAQLYSASEAVHTLSVGVSLTSVPLPFAPLSAECPCPPPPAPCACVGGVLASSAPLRLVPQPTTPAAHPAGILSLRRAGANATQRVRIRTVGAWVYPLSVPPPPSDASVPPRQPPARIPTMSSLQLLSQPDSASFPPGAPVAASLISHAAAAELATTAHSCAAFEDTATAAQRIHQRTAQRSTQIAGDADRAALADLAVRLTGGCVSVAPPVRPPTVSTDCAAADAALASAHSGPGARAAGRPRRVMWSADTHVAGAPRGRVLPDAMPRRIGVTSMPASTTKRDDAVGATYSTASAHLRLAGDATNPVVARVARVRNAAADIAYGPTATAAAVRTLLGGGAPPPFVDLAAPLDAYDGGGPVAAGGGDALAAAGAALRDARWVLLSRSGGASHPTAALCSARGAATAEWGSADLCGCVRGGDDLAAAASAGQWTTASGTPHPLGGDGGSNTSALCGGVRAAKLGQWGGDALLVVDHTGGHHANGAEAVIAETTDVVMRIVLEVVPS